MSSLPNVLIIVAPTHVADAARRALERQAVARCDVASTRDEGMAAMRRSLPDMVVLDFELDEAGHVLDFIAELRETWHLPVVVFSSRTDAAYWQIISRLGPEAVLTKPVGSAKLGAAVRRVFDAQQVHSLVDKDHHGGGLESRKLVESMVELVVATDLLGRVTMVNTGGIVVSGDTAEKLIGKPVDDVLGLVSREGQPIALAESARATSTVLQWSGCEGRLGEMWIPGELKVLMAPMPGPHGGIVGMLIVLSPAEEWYAERVAIAIDGHEKNWRGVFQSIGRGVMVANCEGKVVYMNSVAARLLGTDVDPDVDLSLNEMLPETEWQRLGDPEVRSGLEVFRLRAKASSRVVEMVASPFGDGTIIFPSDVTRMTDELEQRSRETRLDDLGVIARGLAHELNNQLTVVGGALETLDAFHGNNEEAVLMRSAKKAAKRAADVVRKMEIFAKPESGRWEPFAWEGVLVALQSRFRETLKFVGDHPVVMLTGDRDQMVLALENVIENGIQAMRGLENGEIHLKSQCGENGQLRIMIRDEGCGIPAEDLKKVTDPYFSTRQKENAMGLGLTVVDRIVRAHKGVISLRSEPGVFTEVVITLPSESVSQQEEVMKSAVANIRRVGEEFPSVARRGRILILEDEPAVGDVLSIALQRDGWEVDVATEGAEAVARWREVYESGNRYCLLVSDLTIPGGMGGKEAVENIHRFDPQAAALASSGYSDDPVMERPQEFGFIDAVPKPYELKHMLDTVRRCTKFTC